MYVPFMIGSRTGSMLPTVMLELTPAGRPRLALSPLLCRHLCSDLGSSCRGQGSQYHTQGGAGSVEQNQSCAPCYDHQAA